MTGNKAIGWNEFLIAASDRKAIFTYENCEEMFKELDIWAKGAITYDDLERFFGKQEGKWEQILLEGMQDLELYKVTKVDYMAKETFVQG